MLRFIKLSLRNASFLMNLQHLYVRILLFSVLLLFSVHQSLYYVPISRDDTLINIMLHHKNNAQYMGAML